jgi:hypothetical protein
MSGVVSRRAYPSFEPSKRCSSDWSTRTEERHQVVLKRVARPGCRLLLSPAQQVTVSPLVTGCFPALGALMSLLIDHPGSAADTSASAVVQTNCTLALLTSPFPDARNTIPRYRGPTSLIPRQSIRAEMAISKGSLAHMPVLGCRKTKNSLIFALLLGNCGSGNYVRLARRVVCGEPPADREMARSLR